MKDNQHFLFSYGTLQLEKVQIENYGRIMKGEKDSLFNYKLDKLQITDIEVPGKRTEAFYPIAVKTGGPNDFIEGSSYEITETELKATDKYEGSEYIRVLETFMSGRQAWVYVAREEKPKTTIANNIAKIKARIESACKHSNRNPKEVKLLLATKTVGSERIKEAFNCSETLIAENKVQEVRQKSRHQVWGIR